MTSAIATNEVTKFFGSNAVLQGLSLSLNFGERLVLLGPNGAGKTTLIKIILGLISPDSGSVSVLGDSPGGINARKACAYLPESVSFHPSLTGHEQVTLFSRLKKQPHHLAKQLLERVGLGDAMHARVATYSKGMRQKLGLAQLLIGPPRIAILDEPTSGLDPLSRDTFYEMISELAGSGSAVLLSSHALTEIEARTDKVAILKQGKLVACDSLANLRAAAGIPVRMRIEVKPEKANEVAQVLGGQAVSGQAVELSCPAQNKLSVISEALLLGKLVEDIDVMLPSLEDVYRHYGGPSDKEESK